MMSLHVIMMSLSYKYDVITMSQLFCTSSWQAMDFVKCMCSNYLSLVMYSTVWPGVFGVLLSFRPIVYQPTATEYLTHLGHDVCVGVCVCVRVRMCVCERELDRCPFADVDPKPG